MEFKHLKKIYSLLKNTYAFYGQFDLTNTIKQDLNLKKEKLKIFRIRKISNLIENKFFVSQESFKGINSTFLGKNTFISFSQLIYTTMNPNILFLKKYS